MAEAERSRAEAAGAPPARRSEELEELLKRIATHIAEVDQEHPGSASPSILAGPMPSRAAAGIRDTGGRELPPPIPALRDKRIERESGPAAPPAAPIPSRVERAKTPPPAGEGRLPAASLRRAQSALEPPALRSALPAPRPFAIDEPPAGFSEPAAAPRQALREETSVGSVRLTPAYDADAAPPPLRSILGMMTDSPIDNPSSRGREPIAVPGLPDRPMRGSGEAGLAEATRRIEAALATLAPREALDQLGERFSQLEGEVGRAAGELKRLDGLEAQLGVLGTRLTDEQVLALFGPLVPTADDLTRFAEDAASRTADRVLSAHAKEQPVDPKPAADAQGQVEALSERLAAFMDERRRNDAGIQEALETIQLAMQLVLDHIDQSASRQTQEASASAPSLDTQEPAYSGHPETLHAAPEPLPGDMQRFAAAAGAHPSHPSHADVGPASGPILEMPAVAEPELAQPGPAPEPVVVAAAVAAGPPYPRRAAAPADLPRQPRYEPFPQPLAPTEGFHRGVHAAVRQPPEKAHTRTGKHPATKAGRPAKGGMLAGILLGGAAGKSVAGIRPGVLIVTSLAAFLLAGYWLLSSPKVGISGSATEQIENPSTPTSDGEPARPDAAKPAPVDRAPQPAPSRSGGEEPSVPPVGDMQEARMDAAPGRSAGPGMAVVLAAQPITIDSVIHARERARMASLSQRTGAAAAQPQVAPPDASAVVTASLPSASAPPATAPAANRQLTLPPAAAGPLSLRLAAAQGDASAQLEIATRLAEAKGVKQNFTEAALWYERAAAQGEAVAQYRLATLYERGMGVKPDRERAAGLYREAAGLGNVKAMHNLAVMSVSPGAGTPDYAKAAALFAKSAGLGLPDSQYNLGVLYESGLGLPKDHAAAYRWYALAARSGDPEAARRRDLLISRLPAETIEASNTQIASWQPGRVDPRANDARTAGEAWKQRAGETGR